jgi:hypothetical protein
MAMMPGRQKDGGFNFRRETSFAFVAIKYGNLTPIETETFIADLWSDFPGENRNSSNGWAWAQRKFRYANIVRPFANEEHFHVESPRTRSSSP